MKICPVCQSNVFDDMPVCYGCLHEFPEEEVKPRPDAAAALPGYCLDGDDDLMDDYPSDELPYMRVVLDIHAVPMGSGCCRVHPKGEHLPFSMNVL